MKKQMSGIISKFRNSRAKFREFHISFTGGFLAGIPIGLLFVFPKHFILLLIVLLLVYFVGLILITYVYSNEARFSYLVNFNSGILSSSLVGLLITFNDHIPIVIIVSVSLFILVSFVLIKIKR